MGLPVFFPPADISLRLPPGESLTVRRLCERAGIACRVSGPPAERRVRLGCAAMMRAVRRPGPFGEIWIGISDKLSPKRRAFLALGFLAYGVFDYAARECLYGLEAAKPVVGPGRPRKVCALSGAERQARYRAKRSVAA